MLAEVLVNGRSAGIAWTAPYRVDVTALLKPGSNRIEVRTSNLWINRLVGDRQPGVTERISFTQDDAASTGLPQKRSVFDNLGPGGIPFGGTPYAATTPLPASGLIGPVRLVREGALARLGGRRLAVGLVEEIGPFLVAVLDAPALGRPHQLVAIP